MKKHSLFFGSQDFDPAQFFLHLAQAPQDLNGLPGRGGTREVLISIYCPVLAETRPLPRR